MRRPRRRSRWGGAGVRGSCVVLLQSVSWACFLPGAPAALFMFVSFPFLFPSHPRPGPQEKAKKEKAAAGKRKSSGAAPAAKASAPAASILHLHEGQGGGRVACLRCGPLRPLSSSSSFKRTQASGTACEPSCSSPYINCRRRQRRRRRRSLSPSRSPSRSPRRPARWAGGRAVEEGQLRLEGTRSRHS